MAIIIILSQQLSQWSKIVLALFCPHCNTPYEKITKRQKRSQIVLWTYCVTLLGMGFTLGSETQIETLFTEAVYHPDRTVKSLSMHQSFLEYFATFW